MKLLIWAVLSCLTLFVGRGSLCLIYPKFVMWREADKELHMEGWVAWKAFTLGVTTIGLVTMSVFAAVLLGVSVLVLMYLSVYPLKYILKASILRRTSLMLLSISSIILVFPPFMVVAFRGLFDGFSKASFTAFWDWTEMLWSWGSATYPCSWYMFPVGFYVFKFYYISKLSSNLLLNSSKDKNVQRFICNINSFFPWRDNVT